MLRMTKNPKLEDNMGSLFLKNRLRTAIIVLFAAFLLSGASLPVWSAGGYQEEKLFDGDFYTSEEFEKKVEAHQKEIQTLSAQIKALESDIDWLVLKINQIQDSGRTPQTELKQSISAKEKKIVNLLKTKNRLEYLVQYYSAQLDPQREQTLKEILERSLYGLKSSEAVLEKEQTEIRSNSITAQKEIVQSAMPAVQDSAPAVPVDRGMQPIGYREDSEDITKEQLQEAVSKAGLSDWVEINGSGTCLRLETTLPILFPTGSAKIADEYKPFLDQFADFLKPYDVKILVNGYADTVPIHNEKYPSNFELGATRAANIVHQFVRSGLKPSIFRIESTGEYRFAAKGMSQQKTLERRAEVTVIFSG